MSMTKKLAFAVAMSLAAVSAPAVAQQVQPAKIIYIDADGVMGDSNAGKAASAAIQSQAQALQSRMQSLQSSFSAEGDALNKAAQNKTITQAVFEQKAKDLQNRANAANAEIQTKQRQLAANQQFALKQLGDALTPIIMQVMQEKGAQIVLDAGSVIKVAPELDMSSLCLQRLNAKVSSVSTTAPAATGGR
jgi:Skp family chaperone for outer membrane proteins